MHVVARGNMMTHVLNGHVMPSTTILRWRWHKAIGLQIEGGGNVKARSATCG
jgi:hypothetical protein